jgi:D-tyrosyl-tRNA(Tyr) deacylase
MIAIIQRVTSASVTVDAAVIGQIGPGLLALVAVHRDDAPSDISWMANKLASLRLFRNGDKHFDIDIRQSGGGILLVSNFTVAGQTRRGRRPSFDQAAPPEMGRKLFDELVQAVKDLEIPVATGLFGADMLVTLANDGPATFIVDSKEGQEPATITGDHSENQ